MILTLLFSLLAVGVGIVLLLWGYRAFLVMLPIFGFFAGFWIGAHAISAIFGTGFLADVTGLAVGLVAGVVVAVLSYLFYFVGVACSGGARLRPGRGLYAGHRAGGVVDHHSRGNCGRTCRAGAGLPLQPAEVRCHGADGHCGRQRHGVGGADAFWARIRGRSRGCR